MRSLISNGVLILKIIYMRIVVAFVKLRISSVIRSKRYQPKSLEQIKAEMSYRQIRKIELHAFILGRFKDDFRVVISISRNNFSGSHAEMYTSTMDKDTLMDTLDQPTEVYQTLEDLGSDFD